MAYTIKTTNGSTIAVIQDATLNTIATSLTLVGRDYAGYGAFLNENFVYLLENFAANTAPSYQITGQLWYDTSVKTLKVYDSGLTSWKPISSSIAQSTAPLAAASTTGDLWFRTTTNQLYIFTGDITIGLNGWQLIGPQTTSGTTSGAVVETIQDSSSNNHVAIKFYVSNNVVAIVSYDPAYTPQTAIAGFNLINPGLNLISAGTLAGSQFTGNASNALNLNGLSSDQFLRSDINASSAYQLTLGGGLVVGSDLSVTTNIPQDEVRFDGITNNRDMNFYANVSGNSTLLLGLLADTAAVRFVNGNVLIGLDGSITTTGGQLLIGGTSTFNGASTFKQDVTPSNVGTINIGNVSYTFGNVYSNNFRGNLISSNVYVTSGTILGNLTVNGNLNIGSNVVASQSYVQNIIGQQGYNSQGTKRISTSPPSGSGTNGDIWYQV